MCLTRIPTDTYDWAALLGGIPICPQPPDWGAPNFPAGGISSPWSREQQAGHLSEGRWPPNVTYKSIHSSWAVTQHSDWPASLQLPDPLHPSCDWARGSPMPESVFYHHPWLPPSVNWDLEVHKEWLFFPDSFCLICFNYRNTKTSSHLTHILESLREMTVPDLMNGPLF